MKLAAIRDGIGVVGAERRGGAQREGVVTSNVRYYDIKPQRPAAPISGLIPSGGADMMIAMEPLEGLRQIRYLNENTVAIINERALVPVHVRIGDFNYPSLDEIYSRIREATPFVHVFDIDQMSLKHFRSLRQVNTIALGLAYALGQLPVSKKAITETLSDQFKNSVESIDAFELGSDSQNIAALTTNSSEEKNRTR
jgi:indolepyruvate ferredoxin oxidoreductase beta subunit